MPAPGAMAETAASRSAVEDGHGTAGVLGLFAATTFLSAFLLFSIQPIFAKMVLPVLGGSSSVWAVALLFFQAALLAGYLYAHLLMRYVPAPSTGFVTCCRNVASAPPPPPWELLSPPTPSRPRQWDWLPQFPPRQQ